MTRSTMELYKYGSYDEYVKAQEHGNRKKLRSHSGVGMEVMQAIKDRIPEAASVLCHGTRAGYEQQYFKKAYPDAKVLGTEISSTATSFPDTVQWDFSKPKDEWKKAFDIVYSNSFDHSICPKETLEVWLGQVSDGGSLIFEMHPAGPGWKPTPMDPLSYHREDVLALIEELGWRVTDEWLSPRFTDHRGRAGKYTYGRPTLRVQL